MTGEEKMTIAQKKVERNEHRQLLQANRNKEAKSKMEHRRKVLIGEMFIKYFPVALQFTPGKSSDEDSQIFKPLDDYIKSLAESQHAYQKMEDILTQLY